MPKAPVQRVALADAFRVLALYHMRPGYSRHGGSVVRAIVRHNQQKVAGTKLQLNVFERGRDTGTLVMRRHQNSEASTGVAVRMRWQLGPYHARSDLKAKHGNRYC